MAFSDNKGRFAKKNPYVDRRESKNREIKQALVHKARLRKNYLKELKNAGEVVPEKEIKKDTEEEKKAPSYRERARIAKQRKEENRKLKEKEREERKKIIEKKNVDRERRKEKLSTKTRTGQPLMGPRIENLLEKIKKDYTN